MERTKASQSRTVAKIVWIAAFIAVAYAQWPTSGQALATDPLAVMPAVHTAGGPLTEYGLHFDEVGDSQMGGYDYSAPLGTDVWLRGTAEGDQIYPTRFLYWKENSCEVRGRLQLLIGGVWYDYYQYDIHLIHLSSSLVGTHATQYVQGTGDWFYKAVGDVDNCSLTTGAHAHLSGRMWGSDGWFSSYPHSDDTCWANSTQCNDVMSMWKRLHYSCSPTNTWSGWTQGRSGYVADYICQSWSAETRDDLTPAFKKY